MSERIANEKMAEEVKKIKAVNENIENHESLDKNEIEELVYGDAMKFIELFHKSFYEFHENRIKKEEVNDDAGWESTDIVSKIVARIGSLIINLDREVKKENKESSEYKKFFLKVISSIASLIVPRKHNDKNKWRHKSTQTKHSQQPRFWYSKGNANNRNHYSINIELINPQLRRVQVKHRQGSVLGEMTVGRREIYPPKRKRQKYKLNVKSHYRFNNFLMS